MQIGPVKVGSDHPVALQTMTTTDTRDVQATVDQVCLLILHCQPALGLGSAPFSAGHCGRGAPLKLRRLHPQSCCIEG